MSERAALLRAIIENPDDDAPRLAFADWLDAHADDLPEADRESAKARATYIRTMVAHSQAQCPDRPLDPWPHGGGLWTGTSSTWVQQRNLSPLTGMISIERQRLWDIAYPWQDQFAKRWVDEELPPTHTERPTEFDRGFISHLRISPRLLLQDPDRFFNSAPFRKLTLEWNHQYGFNTVDDAAAVAALPQLRRLHEIDFFAAGDKFIATFLRGFLVSPQAAGLRRLSLPDLGELREEMEPIVDALAASDFLGNLEYLQLPRHQVSPDALAALGDSRKLAALRQLNLNSTELDASCVVALFGSGLLERLDGLSLSWNTNFDREATRVLLAQPGFGRFRVLNLSYNPIGDAGCRAIAESRNVGNLEALSLSRTGITGDGIAALLTSESLPSLTTLLLDRSELNAAAVAQFATAKPSIPLNRLNLWSCPIGDDGLRALADSPLLARLTHLRLRECNIGDAGVTALAAGNIANLRELDLSSNQITDAGAEALARSPQLAKLERLDISYNQLTNNGAFALTELPGLKRYGLNVGGNSLTKNAEKKIEAILEARRSSG